MITTVIPISQLVISRQLSSPGELREEIQATYAYREAVEESIDVEVTPVTPAEFLHLLLRSTGQSLRSIRRDTESVADGEARRDLQDAIENILTHVEEIDELLERSDIGLFPALAAALNTNYSKEIILPRKLRIEHGNAYPESIVECLDDLVERLQQIDVSRQYLKALYIQDEPAKLSRHLLYVGVPALLVSALYLRMFAAQTFPSARRLALLPLGVAASIAPLAVLFAYVLRLSVVAQRTLAITPFTTASHERV